MPNSTVPAIDVAWEKFDDVTANLHRVMDLIAAAMIVCENSSTGEGDYAHAVLSAASSQIANAGAELADVIKSISATATVAPGPPRRAKSMSTFLIPKIP